MAESPIPVSTKNAVTPPGIVVDNDIALMRVWGTRLKIPALTGVGDPATMVRRRDVGDFCRRLLGSSGERTALVDDAVDGLFAAVVRGMPIALRGVSDLVPVAYALHRKLFGEERPFVVCDPRRRDSEGSVRVPPSRRTVLSALESATDGSLCLNARRLPADFGRLRDSMRPANPGPTVFVCFQGDDGLRDLLCRPLEILPLVARASESDFLIEEALRDAATALGTARLRIPRHLRQGLLEDVASFAELEKTAMRLVALASERNLSQAAARLRMAPVSLSRWLCRRPSLTAVLRDLGDDAST
jgi:hypothetical protein